MQFGDGALALIGDDGHVVAGCLQPSQDLGDAGVGEGRRLATGAVIGDKFLCHRPPQGFRRLRSGLVDEAVVAKAQAGPDGLLRHRRQAMAGENVVQAFRQFVQRIQDSTVHIEDDGFIFFHEKDSFDGQKNNLLHYYTKASINRQ